jgi:predicted ATP-grasp superfamily ATP-dependent carboligase
LIRWAKLFPDFLFQEYINGTHASVSLISTEHEAISVSVNEQLIGLDSVYAPGPFAYCGNISPFVTKSSERMRIRTQMSEIAEFLTTELGLVGSNGIDFVVTDDVPFVIEVNPRFQGSLDTVELSVKQGEPIATGIGIGDSREEAVAEAMSNVKRIKAGVRHKI